MSDPYKVLNLSPTATDDEVKRAYRELARKYHPDNYHDNPLADLAQEKMKEINEAYELIQKQRKAGASYAAQQTQQSAYSYGYGGSSYGGSSNADPLMQRIRVAISSGDISLAERLLNEATERGAEWNYLMGVVCSRRGWMDDAKQFLQTACRMEPNNAEYRQALQMLNSSGAYRPENYRSGGTMNMSDEACMRLCAAWSCCMLSGGRCFCC